MATILIIEAEKERRGRYQGELRKEGYEVLAANGMRQALRLAGRHAVDLAVLNTVLADGDSVECMQRLLAHQRDLKLVVSTANASISHDFNFWLADRCVPVSADLAELKEAITDLLQPTNTPAGRRTDGLGV